MKNGFVAKKGSAYVMTISLFIIIISVILISYILINFQINTIIYGIKSDLSYILNESLSEKTLEEIAYNSFYIDDTYMKKHINQLLNKNYIKNNSSVKNIEVLEVKLITNLSKDGEHKSNYMNDQFIHVKICVKIKPIVSLVKNNKEVYIHEDIKQINMKGILSYE